jgi:hypothetical protein
MSSKEITVPCGSAIVVRCSNDCAEKKNNYNNLPRVKNNKKNSNLPRVNTKKNNNNSNIPRLKNNYNLPRLKNTSKNISNIKPNAPLNKSNNTGPVPPVPAPAAVGNVIESMNTAVPVPPVPSPAVPPAPPAAAINTKRKANISSNNKTRKRAKVNSAALQ